jgi:L-ascorbate metabolism protein UlaG (beta-lactamase superfamily)
MARLPVPGRLTYVGHATVLIEQDGTRLLTDPVVRRRIGHIRRIVPRPDPALLRSLSGVLISHAHHDHLDVPSLRALELDGPVVAPRGCARTLRRAGLRHIVELAAGERAEVGEIVVEAVEATHDPRRYPGGRHYPPLGFLLRGATSVYFAGDTDLFAGMRELEGEVDVALLPVAGWGNRLPPGHLGPESAARAAAMIRPQTVVPIHWGTLRTMVGRAAGDRHAPVRAFDAAVRSMAPGIDVRVLEPGESMALPDRSAVSRTPRSSP